MSRSLIQTLRSKVLPRRALWRNKDNDMIVMIVRYIGTWTNGIKYYQTDGGTGLPENELTFLRNKKQKETK